MAKQYKANATTFTPIAETSGIIYNAGATDAEIVSDTNQTNGQGLLLRSGTAQSFYGTILARSKDLDDEAVLNVLDFTLAVGGSGGGGGGSSSSTAVAAIQKYAKGKGYKADTLVVDDGKLYLVLKAFTATAIADDVSAGNIVAVSGGGSGVQDYAKDATYAANDLVANGSDLYLVLKAFNATEIEDDVKAGNISLVNSSSVSTSDSSAFMTVAEVDALFDDSATGTTSSDTTGA